LYGVPGAIIPFDMVCMVSPATITVFTWLDAAPQIVTALGGLTIDCGKNGLNIVFSYQMVVEFEQLLH